MNLNIFLGKFKNRIGRNFPLVWMHLKIVFHFDPAVWRKLWTNIKVNLSECWSANNSTRRLIPSFTVNMNWKSGL